VLDIGSGPGTFSVPAAELGAEVIAVDSSIYMFDAIIDRIKKGNLNNIKCHLSPWETFEPPPCDVAICAFAANSLKEEKQFKKLYEKTNKYIFIITQTLSKEYEFGLNKVLDALNMKIKVNKPYLSLVKMLFDHDIPFILNYSEINFHKSFMDDEDVYIFACQRLNIKLDKKFLFETLKDQMLKYEDYVLLLNTKKCAVITIIKGDKYEGEIYS
ncbi:MAG: class I SAM-dependent methyltransferase, partial [Caloramator sp.]|nr:class I SAM-dependent methyltransferase [Caloramator sp.]